MISLNQISFNLKQKSNNFVKLTKGRRFQCKAKAYILGISTVALMDQTEFPFSPMNKAFDQYLLLIKVQPTQQKSNLLGLLRGDLWRIQMYVNSLVRAENISTATQGTRRKQKLYKRISLTHDKEIISHIGTNQSDQREKSLG